METPKTPQDRAEWAVQHIVWAMVKAIRDDIQKAVEAEREACAKVVDGYNENPDWPDWPWTQCAAAIRSRLG